MTGEAPRLRIERLVIVESCSPIKFIRDVSLRAGLNIVWAEELAAERAATEVERAGHGVGKTTFSLMLRAVLGDDGAAVTNLWRHLAEHYGSGGVAAEVLAGPERFAVFRSFGSQGFALRNGTVEGLFEVNTKGNALDFSAYVAALGEQACLRHVSMRALPITGQAIEWGHVLCWIARDQSLGMRQYFEWRNDDGTGLRRKAKDPPTLVRLILGLLTDAEAKSGERVASNSRHLSAARETLKAEEQRGTNTRHIVETELRTWAGVSSSLQMVADDLFAASVEKEIQQRTKQLETSSDQDRTAVVDLDRELVELSANIWTQDRIVKLAKARWEETVALRNRDASALQEIRRRRDEILTISGMCQFGGVAYSDCSHVQAQRDTVNFATQRDIGVLKRSVDDGHDREAKEKAEYEREAEMLADFVAAQRDKTVRKTALNRAIEARARQLGEGDAVRRTLMQWQESHQAPETERLRAARVAVSELERELEAAHGARISAQQKMSERERQISGRISKLAEAFGVNGRFLPFDEKRPFEMLGAEGDAYTVLEILLGDIACAEEGANEAGAHPGLLIFDCPREREMSPHLYDRFIILVDEVCRKAPGLQIIITTTTPPPEPLREPPTRILKLSHASEDDLLLKRRIKNLLSRATSYSADASAEEEA